MIRNLSITILVDNRSDDANLLTEHGFSLWVDADGYRILFDTGQSDAVMHNAEKLGIDVSRADALVFSHGHYDHTGGTAAFFDKTTTTAIYCHSGIFSPRYSVHSDGTTVFIGMKRETIRVLQKHIDAITWITRPMYLHDNIGCTGRIPRINRNENTGGDFYLDMERKRADPIVDDCALWFETVEGIVVLTGCCHAGLMNTLDYVNELTEKKPVRMVCGGLHLVNASEERLQRTAEYCEKKRIGELIPCHCSGEQAVACLEKSGTVRIGGAGCTISSISREQTVIE
jgi:7,8-dihydropterin-6-yl-methyl-4-(beta-D-ribofuranosyl)aminobenzene 5'-phosphate synthase